MKKASLVVRYIFKPQLRCLQVRPTSLVPQPRQQQVNQSSKQRHIATNKVPSELEPPSQSPPDQIERSHRLSNPPPTEPNNEPPHTALSTTLTSTTGESPPFEARHRGDNPAAADSPPAAPRAAVTAGGRAAGAVRVDPVTRMHDGRTDAGPGKGGATVPQRHPVSGNAERGEHVQRIGGSLRGVLGGYKPGRSRAEIVETCSRGGSSSKSSQAQKALTFDNDEPRSAPANIVSACHTCQILYSVFVAAETSVK